MRKILYATAAILFVTACPTTGEIGPPGMATPPGDDDDGMVLHPVPIDDDGAGGNGAGGPSNGGSIGTGGEGGGGGQGAGGEELCPERLETCKENCYIDYLSCKQDCWDTYGNCGAFWECKQDCKDVKSECKEGCDNVCTNPCTDDD